MTGWNWRAEVCIACCGAVMRVADSGAVGVLRSRFGKKTARDRDVA